MAVAAGITPLALGSDTGGSIRQPAAMCGVVGLKPTYGRVSRYGLIAFGSSLDQIGPLTRTVHDAAIALGVIAGADPADATSAPEPVPDYTAALTGDVRGARIGVPAALVGTGVDAEVSDAFERRSSASRARRDARRRRAAAREVRDAGLLSGRDGRSQLESGAVRRRPVRLPRADGPGTAPPAAMYAMDADARGFGPEVKRRIMLGTYVLSAGYYDAYYLKAQQVRTLILRDYDRAFEHVDVVAMPTSPTPPFKIGERVSDPLQMYLGDVFTVSANLAGLPAISVPCGFTAGRLPIGLQLTGRRFDEATLLRIADAYERDTEWWKQQPPIASR